MRHTFDLGALKAKNLPRCTFATLAAAFGMKLIPKGDATPEEIAAATAEMEATITNQVKCFVPPQKECLGCGSILAGSDIAEAYLRATFTYGLAHGEGHCGKCGYPARANHYPPKDGSGLTFARVLQYHPDELEERQPVAEQAAPL